MGSTSAKKDDLQGNDISEAGIECLDSNVLAEAIGNSKAEIMKADFKRNRWFIHYRTPLVPSWRPTESKNTDKSTKYENDLQCSERNHKQHNIVSSEAWLNMTWLLKATGKTHPLKPKPLMIKGPKVPTPPAGRVMENMSNIQHQLLGSKNISTTCLILNVFVSSPCWFARIR